MSIGWIIMIALLSVTFIASVCTKSDKKDGEEEHWDGSW